MMKRIIAAIGLSGALAVSSGARGQEASAANPLEVPAGDVGASASLMLEHPLQRYSVAIEPMIWAPGLRGDVGLVNSSVIDVEVVNADETQIAPAGRATLKVEKWMFQFRGFGFSVDEEAGAERGFNLDGGAVAAGERVRTEFDLYSFDLTLAYELPAVIDNPEDEVRLAFDVFGGARLTSFDGTIASVGGGASASGDEAWGMAIGGARMKLDLPHRLGLNVSVDIGGFPGTESAFTWDITVSFFWMAVENVGLEIGFRHLRSDLQSGDGPNDLVFDAAIAGLFGAVVIRF